MALKPSNISRRNFVHRAGMLVTALGLSGSVQSGLMDQIVKKANKKWGREALAQSGTSIKYMVEICYRAGAQINSLFPSTGHTTPVTSQSARLNIYSSPQNILAFNRDGKTTWIADFLPAAGGMGQGGRYLKNTLEDPTLPGLANVGIAQTEALDLQTGNHTANFSTRAPTGASVAPAVLHAGAIGPARPVQGIQWMNGGGVTNQRGAYPALSAVNSRAQFQSLFRELPMYFSRDELKLIVGAFDENTGALVTEGTLHKLDQMWRSTQDVRSGVYNDDDPVVVNSRGGRNQSTLSLIAALDARYTASIPNFNGTIANADGGTPLGEALNSAVAGFSVGAISTMMVGLDKNDWHGDISAMDTAGSKQGTMNIIHGNALAGLWKSAEQLPDPDGQGVVADHLLVMITSEFARTPLRNGGGVGSDNGDGGTGFCVLMGKSIRNGSYGDIRGTDGAVLGFDANSGATGGQTPTEMQSYRTALKAIGADSMAASFGVGAAAPINAWLK
jgi:hypothetical protein